MMPRRAKRGRPMPAPVPPLTFSPFGRAFAAFANVSSSGKEMHEPIATADPIGFDDGSGKLIKQIPLGSGITEGAVDGNFLERESSEEDTFDGTVQVDFAFFDPKESDFHGVKLLLQNYLDEKRWELSGLVDLILGQPTVGTVVKAEDAEDDGLFSVVTALNLNRYKDHKCVRQLKEHLIANCQEKGRMSDLTSPLVERSKDVGLLVSQHVANFPPHLLPPLYEGLFNEVLWATEDEPTEELQNSFKFKTYLIMTKIYKTKSSSRKRRHSANDEMDIVFIKPEDEVLYELKIYCLMGLVMAIEAEKILTFQQKLKSLIDES